MGTSTQSTEFTRFKHFLSTFKTHLALFTVMAVCLTCLFHVGGSGGTRRRMGSSSDSLEYPTESSYRVSGAPGPLNGLYQKDGRPGNEEIWITEEHTSPIWINQKKPKYQLYWDNGWEINNRWELP